MPDRPFRLAGEYRVFIGLVSTGYLDQEAIRKTIREGIAYCGGATRLDQLEPDSILVKPSLICTDPVLGAHGYTNPTMLSAAIAGLRTYRPNVRIAVLPDHDPFGFSTDFLFNESGYSALARQDHFSLLLPEKQSRVRYVLAKDRFVYERIIEAPAILAESTFRVYCPKIRADHFSSDFAGAVRLGREFPAVLGDENNATDMLEICSPELVIGDAIVVPVGGARSSQRGQELGAILVSNNAVAHDAIAAMILNLDPAHISHLASAAARGWGPATLAQIDIGGAGEQGLRLLSQKTRSWRIGGAHLSRLKERYEYDQPGLKFPLEIHSNSRGAGVLLDSILMAGDSPATRIQISKWPACTIISGPLRTYPANTLVFALGKEALRSLIKMSGQITKLVSYKGITAYRATLKNSRKHWIVELDEEAMRGYWTLAAGFWLGSWGRIRIPILNMKWIAKTSRHKIARAFKSRNIATKLGITSSLAQNRWWTKMPTFRKEDHVPHDQHP